MPCLAAQLYAESNFNPFAESGAGAQGIAQFTPGTAQAYGLASPFDSAQSIDAQAARRVGALCLAALNWGERKSPACGGEEAAATRALDRRR